MSLWISSNSPPSFNTSVPTTLNRIIATASFTIPYPKIIENSCGNSLDFISVSAATESVAEIVALYFTIKAVSSFYMPSSARKGMIQRSSLTA